MTQLREIRLYGHLGQRFGRLHHLAVANTAEAIRALAANFPGFERALMDHKPGWHVSAGEAHLEQVERVHDPIGAADVIRIIPAIAGAKSGWMSILIGVALIAAVAVIAGPAALFATGTLGGVVGSIGFSLVLGGVAQLLAPKPEMQAGSGAAEDQKPSYVFSGPINTSQQGVGVPICYGEMTIGSVVVSTGISVRELPT